MSTRRRVRQQDRPTVTRAEVDAAIAAIAGRHLSEEAAYAEELSDDPGEMLSHLRKRSIDFPVDLRRRDYADAVILARWVADHEAKRIELWALEQGKQLGLTNRQVGEPYGLISRQGVPDRIKALRRQVHGLAAAELGSASAAPAAVAEAGPSSPARAKTDAERELEWLAGRRRIILGLAEELLAYEELADADAADWLAEVRRDVGDGACTPASVRLINFAVDDLAASPAVMALEPGHALLTLIGEWRSLAEEHRAVSRGTGTPSTPAA
jgi:hypothetical protein